MQKMSRTKWPLANFQQATNATHATEESRVCKPFFPKPLLYSHLSLLKTELIPRPTVCKSFFRINRNLAEAMKSTHPTAKSFDIFKIMVQTFSKEVLHRNRNIRPNSPEWSGFVEQVCSMVKIKCTSLTCIHNSCFCMIPSWQNTKMSGRLSIMSTHCAENGSGPLQQSART